MRLTRAPDRPLAGRRMTVQRRAILQALVELGCAQGVEEIYHRARRIYPRLGLVTVYRTLEAMTRQGLAQRVLLGTGPARYELTEEGRHHHHLVCLTCGQVEPLEGCVLGPVDLDAHAAAHRFQVTAHRLELYGYCARCRPRGRRVREGRRRTDR